MDPRRLLTARKLALLGTLYLSQGLPFGFFTQALPVLLRTRGVSLEKIGLSSLLALPWALKFLWAPLVDRYAIPGLGRRRGFILPLQGLAVLCLAVVAAADPDRAGLAPVLVAVLATNLLAAAQDVATDALAVELLSDEERGLGNGVQVAGYRVGMILGGGPLLIFMHFLGWIGTFLVMAGLLALATVPIALFKEPPPRPSPASREREESIAWAALRAWIVRPGAARWLALLLVYKAGDALATGMLRTFFVDRGLDLKDVGEILGTVGFLAGLVGALLGGALVVPLGRRAAVLLFGVLQSLSVAYYAAVAWDPTLGRPSLLAAAALEHLTGGMATAALFTAMMDACRSHHEATDYTVQACVVVIATGAAAAVSGVSAGALGYGAHFALACGLSLVGTALVALLWVDPRRLARPEPVPA